MYKLAFLALAFTVVASIFYMPTEVFSTLLAIALSSFLLFNLYVFYKREPSAFSFSNLNKSFFTMGVLAILLLLVLYLAVVMLKT